MNTRRNFKHLSFTKRIQIETLLKHKIPVKEIAESLGVHVSTIYREVKRGTYEKKIRKHDYYERAYKTVEAYSPDIAQEKYRFHLQNKGLPIKLGNDLELANYIENRIINGRLTPLSVIGEIKEKRLPFKTSICVRTLYNYIYKGVFLNLSEKNLVFEGKRRKHKKSLPTIARAPKGLSIEMRPADILKREEFGHWEMDCVAGIKNSHSALLVLTERLTRREIVCKMERQTADNVVNCINALERRYGELFPKIFKTVTVDNGAEFTSFDEMQRSVFGDEKRTTIYYCHPYCSFERGTNERMNREIRRIFPKGTNFDKVSESEIAKMEEWLNDYPREILHFKSPNTLFLEHFSKLC